ncbi:MAG: DUF2510 domain-containing protein [Actinomycetota bacterium]|nr:DUF2510 domain-containing protein [Actinomycetota bacterium]
MTTQPRPGRSLKRLGLILMAAGVLVGGLSLVFVIRGFGGPIIDAVSSPVYSPPFQTSARLGHHRYVLLQQTGTGSFGGGNLGGVTLGVDDVQVRDPSGNPVPVESSSGNYTVDRNDAQFTSAVTFQASIAGNYQLSIQTSDPAGVILARDVNARGLVPWFAGLGVGALVFVLGFILLLIGFSQQRRTVADPYGGQLPFAGQQFAGQPYGGQPLAGQQPYGGSGQWQPQLPPPGWYADPHYAGRSRYWDGYRWQP